MVRTGGIARGGPLGGVVVPAVHLHAVPLDVPVVVRHGVVGDDGSDGRTVGVAEPAERPAGVVHLDLHLHWRRGSDGLHRLLDLVPIVGGDLDDRLFLVDPESEHEGDDHQDHQPGDQRNALHGYPPERSSGNVLSAKYLLVNILRL